MEELTFETGDLSALKKVYSKAVELQMETFNWKGYIIVTRFTKYIIEYLETPNKHEGKGKYFKIQGHKRET